MAPVDHRNLATVTGRHKIVTEPSVAVLNDVVVIVTQAFAPCGHNLVGVDDTKFDDHPAVTLKLRADGKEGNIHLSPIHGDSRKSGFTDIANGTKCQISCPVCDRELDVVGDVEDGSGARYYGIYLNPSLSAGSVAMISDVWGHYHSRIIDDFELISHWAASH